MNNPIYNYVENRNNISKDCSEEEEIISPDDLSSDFKELVKYFRIINAALLTRTVYYRTKDTELGKTTDLFLDLTLDTNHYPFWNNEEMFIVKEINFDEQTIKILVNTYKLRFALSEKAYKDLKIDERQSIPRMVFDVKKWSVN